MARTVLELRVLDILAEENREMAGIEIADRVGGLLSRVFAALARLQRDGLVSARWDHSGEHPRRLFRIKDDGRRILRESVGEVEQLRLRPEFGSATTISAS